MSHVLWYSICLEVMTIEWIPREEWTFFERSWAFLICSSGNSGSESDSGSSSDDNTSSSSESAEEGGGGEEEEEGGGGDLSPEKSESEESEGEKSDAASNSSVHTPCENDDESTSRMTQVNFDESDTQDSRTGRTKSKQLKQVGSLFLL